MDECITGRLQECINIFIHVLSWLRDISKELKCGTMKEPDKNANTDNSYS